MIGDVHSSRRDLRYSAPVERQLAPSSVDGVSEADEWEQCVERSEEAAVRRVVRVAGVASTPREPSPNYFDLGAAQSGARTR